jgi:hypothetical protein
MILSEFSPKNSDEGGNSMAVKDTMDPAAGLGKHLDQASPDLLRAMVAQFVTQ